MSLLAWRSGGLLAGRGIWALGTRNSSSSVSDLSPRLAHLDFKYFEKNVEEVALSISRRKAKADVMETVRAYQEHKGLNASIFRLRERRNQIAEEIQGLSARKELPPHEKKNLIAKLVEEGKEVKKELSDKDGLSEKLSHQLLSLGDQIPNRIHPAVPDGTFKVLRTAGAKPEFDFAVKDHLQIGKALDILDFESAAECSGTSFYFLKGTGAMLELALVLYAMDFFRKHGYTPVLPPDIVRTSVAASCGYHPRGEGSQIFRLEGTDKCLVGTAEIPIAGMFADKILTSQQLPAKIVAFGHSFRREVGHGGAETRGLYRVHQFSKVELFEVVPEGESEAQHEALLHLQETFFSSLGLHYRVLEMPADDLGASAARKFDVEAWIPSRGEYGEISSASNCLDYQSRRLNVRYRILKNDPPSFAHTINGTACAIPRTILALLEAGQQKDGSVHLPQVLAPFLGGTTVIRPPHSL